MRRERASAVRVGDTIEWCGRWVEVVDLKPAKRSPSGRAGVSLIVSFGGHDRQNHYWCEETVKVREPGDA